MKKPKAEPILECRVRNSEYGIYTHFLRFLIIFVVIPANAGIQSLITNRFIKIFPFWIVLLDHFNFPRSFPFFDLFLSGNSTLCRFVDFIPNEIVDIIFLGKTINKIIFMFINSFNKI